MCIRDRVKALQADESVRCPRNIYEYVLGGEEDKKLLDIRIFEESTKRAAYKRQTEAAEKQGISNCPLCALGNNALSLIHICFAATAEKKAGRCKRHSQQ